MLSVKQSVIVQDYSQIGSNFEVILDWFERFLSKQITKHIEQQASDIKHVWKQWAREKATLRMNNQVT